MNFARPTSRLTTRHFLFAGVAAAAAVLVACGGGGGGTPSAGAAAGTGSAVTRASFSGPITGFGSIIVNGVRIDDSSAQITLDDDNSGADTDLKLGMIVQVEGEKDASGVTGKATSISTRSFVQGPISAAPAGNQFTILGTTVTVSANTLYEGVSGFSGLAANDTVEVHGIANGSGGVDATRVEKKSTADVRLTGTVQNVTASSFQINGITVQYQASNLFDLPNGLTNGMLVRVKGTASGATTAVASKVRQVRLTPEARESQEMELKGIVTRFVSSADFDVNGQAVTLAAGAKVSGTVALNARVGVDGKVTNGVLVAKDVEVEDETRENEYEFHTLIANLDTTAKTFTVRNGAITVRWDDATSFDTSLPQREGSLGNSVKVDVKGKMSGGVLLATRIKRDD